MWLSFKIQLSVVTAIHDSVKDKPDLNLTPKDLITGLEKAMLVNYYMAQHREDSKETKYAPKAVGVLVAGSKRSRSASNYE